MPRPRAEWQARSAACRARGSMQATTGEWQQRWLGTEWSEGTVHEPGRPAGTWRRSCVLVAPKNRPAGVRAPIVARKRGNSRGAKGATEGGYARERPWKNRPARVSPQGERPEESRQAGEPRSRWWRVQPRVWTVRMLAALETGVKGGKWATPIGAGLMRSSRLTGSSP